MNDQEIDALIAAAAAVSDEHVASLPLGALATDLREHIMTTTESIPLDDLVEHEPAFGHQQHGGSRALRLIMAAAVIALIAGVFAFNTNGEEDKAYAAELVAFAEGSPRLLLRAEDWQVTLVNEINAERGEMRFGLNGTVFGGPSSPGGENTLEVSWRPAGAPDPFQGDVQVDDVSIAGHQARLFKSSGSDTMTAHWLQNGLSVEVRADRITEADYRTLVEAIEAVDVNTWLDALPESFIRPEARADTVTDLRQGIPEPAALADFAWDGIGVTDRDALGVYVTGTIACGWIEQFEAATATGDDAAGQEARAALAGAHEWPALKEMDQAGFPEVLWRITDEIVETGVVGPAGGADTEGYVNSLCLPR